MPDVSFFLRSCRSERRLSFQVSGKPQQKFYVQVQSIWTPIPNNMWLLHILYVCQALAEQKRLAEDLSHVLETANAFICGACAPVFDGSVHHPIKQTKLCQWQTGHACRLRLLRVVTLRAAHMFHAMQTCMPRVVTSLRFALMALWDT